MYRRSKLTRSRPAKVESLSHECPELIEYCRRARMEISKHEQPVTKLRRRLIEPVVRGGTIVHQDDLCVGSASSIVDESSQEVLLRSLLILLAFHNKEGRPVTG
jgi:hypothetical protein